MQQTRRKIGASMLFGWTIANGSTFCPGFFSMPFLGTLLQAILEVPGTPNAFYHVLIECTGQAICTVPLKVNLVVDRG
ncbi:MAG: hypothetical protein ACFFB7_07320 [Candidatus Sifarchaeia archaeon]